MSNLPTLNQMIGSGGQYPQTVPAYSTIPEGQNQQYNQPQYNQNQYNQNQYNQPQYNQNQYNQNQYNQPQYNQNQYNQNQYNQPQYNQNQQWNQNYFRNEIYNLRNQYGMQIPDNQIDDTLEAAKANKRMYAFTDEAKNYIKYDEKGKSYIAPIHPFNWAHKDNKQFFDLKNNLENSYDGTSAYLIKVCWIDMKLKFNHVRPVNYKLYINQSFENLQIKGQMKIRVFAQEKEVFSTTDFPNAEMVKHKNLTEFYICDIKSSDFDLSRLDNNGDAVVRIEFSGNNNSWKKGWTFDGARLVEC